MRLLNFFQARERFVTFLPHIQHVRLGENYYTPHHL